MNTLMFTHPITAEHLAKLSEDWGVEGKNPGQGWFEVLLPDEKMLACGDVGTGAMKEWAEIATLVKQRLKLADGPAAPRVEINLDQ